MNFHARPHDSGARRLLMRISLGILVAIAVFCLLFFANDRRRDTLRARAEADASSAAWLTPEPAQQVTP